VNTQAKIQPDAFEQLKSTLEDAPWNYDFLAEYVRELELRRQEQDVFLRLAFQNASGGRPAFSSHLINAALGRGSPQLPKYLRISKGIFRLS
jgi:hypothetical protein